MRALRFVSALGLLALGSAIAAHGAIVAEINGSAASTSMSGNTLIIHAGSITADAIIHVFDNSSNSTTDPSTALSQVILRGTVSTVDRSEALAGAVGWSACWCIGRVLRLGDDTTG